MRRTTRALSARHVSASFTLATTLLVAGLVLLAPRAASAQSPSALRASAVQQMAVLAAEKQSRTAAQRKLGSRLHYALLKQRRDPALVALPDLRVVSPDADGHLLVDIDTTSGGGVAAVQARLQRIGAQVVYASARYRTVRARIPLVEAENLAAMPEVRHVALARKAMTNKVNASRGDKAHRARDARNFFGVTGAGVKICVLSNGVGKLAAVQATGDLPPGVEILPGQTGSGREGTAMLEIIHDLAPGAALGFATAFTSEASFAQNILDLRNVLGCDIIVDDVIYSRESPFQDNDIAESVNIVTAAGALYFSAAGNEGNKNDGTSGTWQGNFKPNGTLDALPGSGTAHDFGDGGQSNLVTASGSSVTLHWTDPYGASANDYDLYIFDGNLTTMFDASTSFQNGNDDPFEVTGPAFTGERIVILKFSGQDRLLNTLVLGGQLAINTKGCIRGHNSAVDAFAVAAVDVATAGGGAFVGGAANPVELFSCDGPRRIFFDNDGNLLPGAPAGNFLKTGGVVRKKPDIAAADGVATATPGFSPFFGTSAAAPHAAAIAGLIQSAFPAFTPAEVRAALVDNALDIEKVGTDRDSGNGIVMAFETLAALGAPTGGPDLRVKAITDPPATKRIGRSFSVTDTVKNNGSAPTSAAGASTTRYYLSSDVLPDGGDTLLTGTRSVPALGPTETSTGTVTVTVPVGITPGTYFLLGCADDLPAVAEFNENNNCKASATKVTVVTP